jgi:hypothetical protein
MTGTNNTAACAIEECRKIFLELSKFWKLCLIGLVSLLGMYGGAWAWTWKEMRDDQVRQDKAIEEMQSAFDDVRFLRTQSDEILDNQKEIIKYFERMSKRPR